jgi:NAD(P)H-dependent FMN reductase
MITMTDSRPQTAERDPRPLALAVLIGSVRPGRLGPTVADWFVGLARTRGDVRLDVIDPALSSAPSPAASAGTAASPGTAVSPDTAVSPTAVSAGTPPAASDIAQKSTPAQGPDIVPARADREGVGRRLAAADGFVVVTPEYNHSYPAALKHLIDDYRREWYAKPVGFVSYGGVSGGLRAVEHLRAVFAEQHMVTVRDGVSIHGATASDFADGGRLTGDTGTTAAVGLLLDRMVWWGRSLRAARENEPYQ